VSGRVHVGLCSLEIVEATGDHVVADEVSARQGCRLWCALGSCQAPLPGRLGLRGASGEVDAHEGPPR
jgi:hypothetical protein